MGSGGADRSAGTRQHREPTQERRGNPALAAAVVDPGYGAGQQSPATPPTPVTVTVTTPDPGTDTGNGWPVSVPPLIYGGAGSGAERGRQSRGRVDRAGCPVSQAESTTAARGAASGAGASTPGAAAGVLTVPVIRRARCPRPPPRPPPGSPGRRAAAASSRCRNAVPLAAAAAPCTLVEPSSFPSTSDGRGNPVPPGHPATRCAPRRPPRAGRDHRVQVGQRRRSVPVRLQLGRCVLGSTPANAWNIESGRGRRPRLRRRPRCVRRAAAPSPRGPEQRQPEPRGQPVRLRMGHVDHPARRSWPSSTTEPHTRAVPASLAASRYGRPVTSTPAQHGNPELGHARAGRPASRATP